MATHPTLSTTLLRTDAPTHRRTDAPTHRRTDAPTLRRSDAPTLRRSDAPTLRRSDASTHGGSGIIRSLRIEVSDIAETVDAGHRQFTS
jgi:hypothetical protein